MIRKSALYLLLAAMTVLCACTEKGWGVEGKIANAEQGAKVAVEGLNGGIWYNIDSVEIAADGSFSYRAAEGSPYPDIYRISLDGKCVYFPIDSLENISIVTDAKNFDTGYTLSGSPTAERMQQLDRRIAEAVAKNGAEATLNDSVFKRELGTAINEDTSGVLAYYLINKTIGDKPIFLDNIREDVRVLGAIANKFEVNFPDDPRTAFLRERYLNAKRAFSTSKNVIEAGEMSLIDIDLIDENGAKQLLSKLAKGSGATLLNITSYEANPNVSMAYNTELSHIYDKYKSRGLKIYQVSVGDNEVQWRGVARDLPWTTVYSTPDDAQRLLMQYNVTELPTSFIIDGNGDLVARLDNDLAKLEGSVAKYLK